MAGSVTAEVDSDSTFICTVQTNFCVPVVIQCVPEVADGPLDLGTVSQGPKSVPAVGFSLVQAPQQQTSSHLNKWKEMAYILIYSIYQFSLNSPINFYLV